MVPSPASANTKAGSKQTYYTIRFLVDRQRVDDAFRAYGYFRWVDNVLDADSGSRSERKAFLERQKSLLEKCYQGESPRDPNLQERMLVELVQGDHEKNSTVRGYRSGLTWRELISNLEKITWRRSRISAAELQGTLILPVSSECLR